VRFSRLVFSSNRRPRRLAVLAAVAAGALSLSVAAAFASTWASGDIFVGVSNGNYNVYSNAGVFKETINGGSGFTTGCAFNNDQSALFTTFFSQNNVVQFATPHPHTSSVFAGGLATPESVAFDKLGDVFVTEVSGGGIRMYSPTGTLIKTIIPGTRTDWVDLAADQDTLFWTDETNVIHRASVATGTALPDFATTGGRFALRILPDGGVLVANEGNILRYNAAGTIIQTYDRAGNDGWFALNLDPNGTSFWSADFETGDVVKFNIATGAVENNFNTGTGPSTVFGLCLKGEITVGGGDTTKPLCSLKDSFSGPPAGIHIKTQDTGSGLASITVTSSTNADVTIPTFTPGTTAEVDVTAARHNNSLSASVQLTVKDVAGNTTVCDPVLTSSVRSASDSQPASQTYNGLDQAESKVTIMNGNPGMKKVTVEVNGTKFRELNLDAGQVVHLDVSSAMQAGSNNTVTISAKGQKGASADIVIADS
jgi:hypothetical protein